MDEDQPATSTPVPTRRRNRRRLRPRGLPSLWITILAVTVVGIALRAIIVPLVRWNSPHDDEAMIQYAAAILDGRWLGEWGEHRIEHMTMAKTPGYSVFLAAIHWTGLTPSVASYLLYLLGALLLVLALRPRLGDRWSVVLYVALALSPEIFGPNFSQVYRDQLVTALTLLVLGLSAQLAGRLARPHAWTRRSWPVTALAAVGLGLTFALLQITRNDIHWVVLTTVLILVIWLVVQRRAVTRRSLLGVGLVAGVVTGLALSGPVVVERLNEHHYGVALTNDYSSGQLARAITIWASIETGEENPRALVDRSQREAAYEVSPTAADLGVWLEVDAFNWIDLACSLQSAATDDCDDYIGYFAWALRDAAVREGVSSPAELQTYFGRLADEIETACTSGDLTCGARAISPNVPSLDKVSPRSVLANFTSYLHTSLSKPPSPGTQQKPAGNAPVALWTATINGADIAYRLSEAELQPSTMAQTTVYLGLRTVANWFLIPLAVLAVVRLFARRTWGTVLGRVALACLAGWLGNLAIVALFYAAVNRNMTNTNPLYIMASQSYLITGLILIAAVTWQDALAWVRATIGRPAPEPAEEVE